MQPHLTSHFEFSYTSLTISINNESPQSELLSREPMLSGSCNIQLAMHELSIRYLISI